MLRFAFALRARGGAASSSEEISITEIPGGFFVGGGFLEAPVACAAPDRPCCGLCLVLRGLNDSPLAETDLATGFDRRISGI